MDVDNRLKEYIVKRVLPQYADLDMGHNEKHIQYVIQRSLDLADKYGANVNMAYAIAAFHDLGMVVRRENHEIIGAEILEHDEMINYFFSLDQISIMEKAIREHRASFKGEYSSIYSKIVSQADRNFDIYLMTTRSIGYGLKEYPDYNYEEQFKRTYDHLRHKYGRTGYAHMILEYKEDTKNLEYIWAILDSEDEYKKIFKRCYDQMTRR